MASNSYNLSELSDQQLMDILNGRRQTKSPLASYGRGLSRTAGRLRAGMQQGISYLTEGLEESPTRETIRERERIAEAEYLPYRQDNPTAAFLGEGTPYLFGAGPVTGGLLGALTYAEEPEQRALQAGAGMAGGGLTRMLRKAPSVETAEARLARRGGIETTPGQRTGFKPLQRLEASMESFAPTSGPFSRMAERNQRTVNRAAANAIGEEGDKVTGEVLERARSRLSDEFDDILNNTEITIDDRFVEYLSLAKQSEIGSIIKPEKDLDYTIEALMNKMDEGVLSGKEYQKFRRQLQQTIHKNFTTEAGDRTYAESLTHIADGLDDAAERSLSGGQLDRFKRARQQWANLRILRNPRSVKIERGDVMPVSAASVAGRQDELGYRLGRNQQPFYQTLRGANAIPPVVGNSGTAERSLLMNLAQSRSPAQLATNLIGYAGTGPVLSNAYMYAPGLLRALTEQLPMAASVPAAGLLGR